MTLPSRRFWPVIHTESYDQAARNVNRAADAGAHGVFLINMSISVQALSHIIVRLPRADIAIGANWLGLSNVEAQEFSVDHGLAAFWTDSTNSKLESVSYGNSRAYGLDWFGGVAHKGNQWVYDADLSSAAAVAAEMMEVPTMTGSGTGVAADPARTDLFRSGLPDGHRLGLASGITPDNAEAYLPFVTDYLAATGIQSSFTELDPLLMGRLAEVLA